MTYIDARNDVNVKEDVNKNRVAGVQNSPCLTTVLEIKTRDR